MLTAASSEPAGPTLWLFSSSASSWVRAGRCRRCDPTQSRRRGVRRVERLLSHNWTRPDLEETETHMLDETRLPGVTSFTSFCFVTFLMIIFNLFIFTAKLIQQQVVNMVRRKSPCKESLTFQSPPASSESIWGLMRQSYAQDNFTPTTWRALKNIKPRLTFHTWDVEVLDGGVAPVPCHGLGLETI